jgi:hypothetical protein
LLVMHSIAESKSLGLIVSLDLSEEEYEIN